MPPDALAALRAEPARAAILLDVDGTLAPIVDHPADSAVPAGTLATLARLVDRYGLVGCVSGRAAQDAARLVPVPGVAFSGNHGLELLEDGVVHTAPDVDPYLPALRELTRRLTPIAAGAGAWIEDKGATLAVHYRQASSPAAARELLERDAVPLVAAAGLEPRFGRLVLEVRPPVPLDKGTAVRRLMAGRPLTRSLYAGDDATDLDAFAVVDVAVAVRSEEMPAGLLAAATVVVDGPAGLAALLAGL